VTTSRPKPSPPSHTNAGDDVEAEFEADKAADVEAELPKTEAPSALPGWGMWAGMQREPRWMKEAKEKAEK